jgi:hypothetical protein
MTEHRGHRRTHRALRHIHTTLLAAVTLVVATGCSGFGLPDAGPRLPGPYDPGRGELPTETRIVEVCGSYISTMLYDLSDSYVSVATEWERYQTYHSEIKDGGVSPEELEGLSGRKYNIENYISWYRSSAESLRSSAAGLSGITAKDCDREVVVPFEREYTAREKEMTYVEKESRRILTGLGGE